MTIEKLKIVQSKILDFQQESSHLRNYIILDFLVIICTNQHAEIFKIFKIETITISFFLINIIIVHHS
jgi:hypothetical protein